MSVSSEPRTNTNLRYSILTDLQNDKIQRNLKNLHPALTSNAPTTSLTAALPRLSQALHPIQCTSPLATDPLRSSLVQKPRKEKRRGNHDRKQQPLPPRHELWFQRYPRRSRPRNPLLTATSPGFTIEPAGSNSTWNDSSGVVIVPEKSTEGEKEEITVVGR